jgi:uncharacterized integral membrane protein (TIGR00698 family)
MRRVLRFAIILLGLQLSLAQVVEVGAAGLGIIAFTLGGTFLFTVWLGRRLAVDRKLVELIASGTSICGASAVVATNTVTRASEEDVAYAVACVTVFGSASMLLYPALDSYCSSHPMPLGCGPAPRFTRLRKSLPPLSRTAPTPAISARSQSSAA